jgi:hypothetical protein
MEIKIFLSKIVFIRGRVLRVNLLKVPVIFKVDFNNYKINLMK